MGLVNVPMVFCVFFFKENIWTADKRLPVLETVLKFCILSPFFVKPESLLRGFWVLETLSEHQDICSSNLKADNWLPAFIPLRFYYPHPDLGVQAFSHCQCMRFRGPGLSLSFMSGKLTYTPKYGILPTSVSFSLSTELQRCLELLEASYRREGKSWSEEKQPALAEIPEDI